MVSRKAQVNLSPVDVSADGVYTCTAENEAGSARHEVVLDVLGTCSLRQDGTRPQGTT